MSLLNELFRGAIILGFVAVAQYGCKVKDMANKASSAHKKGLTSYGAYSRALTGSDSSIP